MLTHHDTKPYELKLSESAALARAKFDKVLADGRSQGNAIWKQIHRNVPQDMIAAGRAIRFGYAAPAALAPAAKAAYLGDPALQGVEDADGIPVQVAAILDQPAPVAPVEPVAPLVMQIADHTARVHDHALGQVAQRASIPGAYLRELMTSPEPSLRDLALEILRRHFGTPDIANARYLVRELRGEARGFLSDRYRRLDTRPLVDAFAAACKQAGAVPGGGTATDLKVALKAYYPTIFEPIPNEPMLVGVEFGNSDYGAGTLNLSLVVLRLWCTNGAVMESPVKTRHLGGRLAEDIAYSQETYDADNTANALAIRDTVQHLLDPKQIVSTLETIVATNSRQVDANWLRGRVARLLTKSETNKVIEAFDGPDVVNLPPVKSVWRASNAISWLVNQVESQDRRIDLERMAGDLLRKAA